MRATRVWGIVIVMQAMILAGQWLGSPALTQPAQAQPLDPGRDRLQMIDELKSVNAKLDRLIALLEGGDLQVRVANPDEKKADRPAR
jgi:hypothetical protein